MENNVFAEKTSMEKARSESAPMKNDSIKIVLLAKEHVPRLAEMERELFSLPWSERAFQELLTHEYCHYLVALKDGVPVGFAGMTVLADEGDVDKVMVDPAFQRSGVADRLLGELFRLGDALGVTAYTLEVRVSNVPAIRLYEKHGFQGEGVRPGFYEKPAEDALIMWRRSGKE